LSTQQRFPGPDRDFVGYGPNPPDARWPGGAAVAINLVVNYEEGGEYALGDDGANDTWGESSLQYGPEVRDLGTESHMEYGSRVGVWRLCRLADRYGIDVTFNACARALERNPPLCEWLRARNHDVLGHGYRWYGPDTAAGGPRRRPARLRRVRPRPRRRPLHAPHRCGRALARHLPAVGAGRPPGRAPGRSGEVLAPAPVLEEFFAGRNGMRPLKG